MKQIKRRRTMMARTITQNELIHKSERIMIGDGAMAAAALVMAGALALI
jgi:hypothetical protein